MKKYSYLWKNALIFVLALVFAIPAAIDFSAMQRREEVAKNDNLTEVKMLSEYCEGLKGTPADTEIYVFDSGVKGGIFLIFGGTHPNETAGMLAAVSLVENMKPTAGRFFIIPWLNKSGFTHTSPLDGMQDFFDLTLNDGSVRTFRVGNRLTNPVHQWPDRTYYEGTSGRKLVGTETAEIRNVNRMYYGNPDGVLTEKVCWGIYQLILQENVNLTMDMHEGSPEFLYLDCTMVNEKADNATAMSIAQGMSLDMEFDDLTMRAEFSGMKSYGLSHRSLGDNTASMMTLMETYNPSMGPLHGKMDDDLIINGNEPNYVEAYQRGLNYFPVTDAGYPLIERVARHITCIRYLAKNYTDVHPELAMAFEGLGTYEEMVKLGMGGLLKPLN